MKTFLQQWSRLIDSVWFYPLALVLALAVFFPVISQNPLVDIDYELVINPLRHVHSLADYSRAFIGKKLLDIQPIRDFSLLFDLKFESLLGHQVFGFFNLLFWLGSCFFLERILVHFCPLTYARAICLMTLIHPLLSWVISWPTARKHLLATFFLLLASWLAVLYKQGKEKAGIWILLAYTLSVYSQPIGLLWIGVFVLYLGKDGLQKKHWPLLGLLGIVFVFTTIINFIYFDQIYPMLVGIEKTSAAGAHSTGLKIISFSRSLSQILIPLQFAPEYAFHSLLNYVGLPLFMFLIWLFSLRVDKKDLITGAMFALHPLFLINFRSTNIFVSDTYLLIPLAGLGALVALFLSSIPVKKFPLLALITLVLLLAAKAGKEAKLSTQEGNYFKVGFEREPNCRNALAYANYLLRVSDLSTFYDVSGSALSNSCFLGGHASVILMGQLYAFRVFLDQKMPAEEKQRLISKVKVTPAVSYLDILLKTKMGDKEAALAQFRTIQRSQIYLTETLRKIHALTCTDKVFCDQIKL